MARNEPVYHHRIPQTYMKPWCFSNNSIWTYDALSQKSEIRNIENICGTNHYHSIRAGSLYTNEDALEKIFGFLSPYKIEFEGNLLNTVEELNKYYIDFDNWVIYYPKGQLVNRKDLNIIKQRLSTTSVNTIEEQWNIQLENDWNSISTMLLETLKRIQNKEEIALTDHAADRLMKYFIMFEWRGKIGNATVNDIFDFIFKDVFEFPIDDIPKEDRIYPNDKTAEDEMKHAFLLKSYDSFLSEKGAMYETYKIYLDKLTFLFLIADNATFITSDNPCFTFQNKDSYKEPMFVALPNLIVSLAKKDPAKPNSYKILNLDDEQVDYYNRVIIDNGNMILSTQELTV